MDFHARQYDPQIGRFLSVDPLGDAPGQETYGTYAAMGNMPESTIDPDGMQWTGAGPTRVYSASPFTFGPMQHIALMFPSLHLYMPNWQIFSNGPESSVAALLQRLAGSEAQQNGNARRSDSYDVPNLSAILGPGGATRCYHGGSSGNTNDGDSPEHFGPDKNTNGKKQGGATDGGSTTWDPVTDKRISEIDERLQQPAIDFINAVEAELGIKLRVVQGYRSIKEQDDLYAQGRTMPGNKVTNARGGSSYHNYGLAIDVAIMENGQPNWNKPINSAIADFGIRYGFDWGGNWKSFKDYPHFEMTFGQSLSDLRKR